MNAEYEFKIEIYGKKITVFMQNGFFQHDNFTQVLHHHNYFEIHSVAEGEATLKLGNNSYYLQKGDILLVDVGENHRYEDYNREFCPVIFQFSCNAAFKEKRYQINPLILQSTINAVDDFLKTGDAAEIKAFLMIICAKLFKGEKETLNPITDPKFIISEYFSVNYISNANISELADKLGVGTKQASRLVKKHTGNNFRDELTKKRITMAKMLVEENALSLKAVAERVGYTSYSGFWKAYNSKKFK